MISRHPQKKTTEVLELFLDCAELNHRPMSLRDTATREGRAQVFRTVKHSQAMAKSSQGD